MFDPAIYSTFVLACVIIVIVPGPSVTVIIANSLRGGEKAGLMTVAGTQFGLIPMIFIVAIGLEAVVQVMSQAFFWLKLIGAAYLIWLGIRLLRSNGQFIDADGDGGRRGLWDCFWQGMLVIWSNPKALLFLGAFLPQFVSPAGSAFVQTLALGVTFMIVASVFDSIYAVLAGRAGSMLTRRRVRSAEVMSGGALMAGGVWLALSRQN